jgi:DNA-binding transcriptional MerR regulator
MTSQAIPIGTLSRLSGISTHTLRFYEKQGILKPVGRADNGHRRYRQQDLLWLAFVVRLKRTGMPLAQIREYADLRADGDDTLGARLAMLERHRGRLAANIDELTACAGALEDKIAAYRQMIAQAPAANEENDHAPIT